MKTKEAIEFVKDEVLFAEDNYDENIIKKRDKVIFLLQQGEKCRSDFTILVGRWDELFEENKINKKYRLIWGMFKDYLYHYEGDAVHRRNYKDKLNQIEQKYFPKEETNEIKSWI